MTSRTEDLRKMLVGPVVAVTTPFKDDLSIDFDGLRSLVDFYCDSGIGPLIVAGSTGEFFSMTDEERMSVIRVAIEQARGRLPIIAGCAHSGTQLAAELVKQADALGAVGTMVTPPYYGFSGFEGLKRHYEIIGEQSDLPVLVYFSGAVRHLVTDFTANPDLLGELAKLPNVAGFKDSTEHFWFLRDISIKLKDKIAIVASAGLGYYLWAYDYSAPAWITGIGNIWPEKEIGFYEAIKKGDREAAFKIAFEQDRPYIQYIKGKPKRYNYWAAVKALLDMEGLPGGRMRPPLLDWPSEDLGELRAAMQQIGLMKR